MQKLADARTTNAQPDAVQGNDSVTGCGGSSEYHRHEHKIDEFFVLDGRFLIDLEDRVIDLAPRQKLVVPGEPSKRAPERTGS